MLTLPAQLTQDEMEVLDAYRKLKPYGVMKVAKNQNGAKLTVSMEESFTVEVERYEIRK